MDLYPSDIEEAVRAACEVYLRENLPLGEARARPKTTWKNLASMGWFGIAIAEDAGGIGLSHAAEALVFAQLGRALAPIGVIAASVAAYVAATAGEQALTQTILSGEHRVALGLPEPHGQIRVIDAEHADLLVLLSPDRATIHDRHASPQTWAIRPCLDPSTSQTIIDPPTTHRATAEGAHPTLHQMLATAAFALGTAEAARDMAAAYALTREQFGRPIGAFQGVKHPCADMAVRCSSARAQLLYAAVSFDDKTPDAAFQVAAAKHLSGRAALENGRTNVQVHGGIGMTDECNVHLLLKRAHLLQVISPVSAALLLTS